MSELEKSRHIRRSRAIIFGIGITLIAVSAIVTVVIAMQPRAIACGETLATVIDERSNLANTSRGLVRLSEQVLRGDDGQEYIAEASPGYLREGDRVRVFRRCTQDGDVLRMPAMVELA